MTKLKINKACDLNSISVLPPHSRRGNAIPPVTEFSSLGKSQGSSQLWSQSQQSFSQSMSMSQLSQNSQEEILTNDHRFGSQDNSLKRISCLAPITYAREDGQMAMSRSSNNVMHRWSSSSTLDHKCRVSQELEHRMGLMETSLSRLGMVLNSVQNDVMQVNKAVKDASMEMDGIRQKILAHDSSLQLVLKGEEDIKARLDVNLKAVSDQLRKESNQHKLDEVESSILALPGLIENQLLKLQNELCQTFTKEVERASSMNPLSQPHQHDAISPPKRKRCSIIQVSPKQQPLKENPVVPLKCYATNSLVPKTEAEKLKFHARKGLIMKMEPENFKSLKPKAGASTNIRHNIKLKKEEVSVVEKEPEWEVIIESDEEIDGDLSFLLEKKDIRNQRDMFPSQSGNRFIKDAREETDQILRRARRKRRRNIIVV